MIVVFSLLQFFVHIAVLCLYAGYCNCAACAASVPHIFDHLKPHFYIVKLGLQGYTLYFLFLLKKVECGYSLELQLVPTIYFFE